MEKYGFVYIWFDRKHKRYYVGCRWGTENDGYICSSSWMKKAYRYRPDDFRRRILKSNIKSKQETLEEEYRWLSKIKDKELGIRYYNLHNHHFNHWSASDNHLTIRERMSAKWTSERKQQTSHRMKTRIVSEETKQKLRDRPKEIYKGFTGNHSTETIEKMRQSHKNISLDTRLKMSESHRGLIQTRETIEKRVRKTKLVNDKRKERISVGMKNHKAVSIPLMVDGIHYPSISEAVRMIGQTRNKIMKRAIRLSNAI